MTLRFFTPRAALRLPGLTSRVVNRTNSGGRRRLNGQTRQRRSDVVDSAASGAPESQRLRSPAFPHQFDPHITTAALPRLATPNRRSVLPGAHVVAGAIRADLSRLKALDGDVLCARSVRGGRAQIGTYGAADSANLAKVIPESEYGWRDEIADEELVARLPNPMEGRRGWRDQIRSRGRGRVSPHRAGGGPLGRCPRYALRQARNVADSPGVS
jgi:hypothetical protein